MSNRSKTVNLETEKYVLGCLLKYPSKVHDYIIDIKKIWFASKANSQIFEGIVYLAANGNVSKIALLEYFKNSGINEFDKVPVEEYLEVLASIYDLSHDNFANYIGSLKKYYIARAAFDACEQMKKDLTNNLNEPMDKILSLIQGGFSDIGTSEVTESVMTTDLFGELDILLNHQEESNGVVAPFHNFSKMYGDFVPGNCYGVTAGFGDGKSTFLDYLAKKCVLMKQNNCRVLYLDTELSPNQNANRFLSCLTGENEYIFQKGLWRDNKELSEKVRAFTELYKKHRNRYHYKEVELSNAKDLISIIRRWCNKFVKDGEIPLIVYDYMKITGEKVDSAWNEYNLLGEKTNALHQLSRELGAAVIFAAQTNQEGRIASSNRINWFASNMYSLRSKTPEEMQEHGEENGTHILDSTKTRQQGEMATGFQKYIKVPQDDGTFKFKTNFINFKFENFRVEEKGTYKDMLQRNSEKLELQSQ